MPREHEYFVYIVASRSRILYIGVANNLILRVFRHREGKADAFTARYTITRLVSFERHGYIDKAIAREKSEALHSAGEDRPDRVHQPNMGGPRC